MTNELCVSECESRGFSFAATQYYTECCKDTTPPCPGLTNMAARLWGVPADDFRGGSCERLQYSVRRSGHAAMRWT